MKALLRDYETVVHPIYRFKSQMILSCCLKLSPKVLQNHHKLDNYLKKKTSFRFSLRQLADLLIARNSPYKIQKNLVECTNTSFFIFSFGIRVNPDKNQSRWIHSKHNAHFYKNCKKKGQKSFAILETYSQQLEITWIRSTWLCIPSGERINDNIHYKYTYKCM